MMKYKEWDKRSVSYFLLEAGYSRLMNIISGRVPKIKSFAIITAENPNSKKPLPKGSDLENYIENQKRNKKLENVLKKGFYGYRKIEGEFGEKEKPFFIMNMTPKQAVKYGNMFQQSSVIFGKTYKDSDKIGIKFYYFDLVKGKIDIDKADRMREVWKSVDDEKVYSQYKGRKFIIPFFDSLYRNAKLVRGNIVGIKKQDLPKKSLKEVEKLMKNHSDEYIEKHNYEMRGRAKSIIERMVYK